jgi:hypothetical protein
MTMVAVLVAVGMVSVTVVVGAMILAGMTVMWVWVVRVHDVTCCMLGKERCDCRCLHSPRQTHVMCFHYTEIFR